MGFKNHPGSKFFHPGYLDPHERIKIFLTQILFLISRKYEPGYSSRIRILIFFPSRIPDPGIKKAPDPASGSTTLQKAQIFMRFQMFVQMFQIWTLKMGKSGHFLLATKRPA